MHHRVVFFMFQPICINVFVINNDNYCVLWYILNIGRRHLDKLVPASTGSTNAMFSMTEDRYTSGGRGMGVHSPGKDHRLLAIDGTIAQKLGSEFDYQSKINQHVFKFIFWTTSHQEKISRPSFRAF